MDPLILVLTVLIISGLWGSIILAGLFRRWNRKLERPADDPRISQLQEGHEQLEARLERLEEEIGFFRELNKPEPPNQLPGPDSGQSEAKG
jgi:Zn-dependent protease with chaperone function